MDKTNLSGKRYLFAYCITDGAFDDWDEERRTAMILDITEIKEELLNEHQPTDSTRKNTKKSIKIMKVVKIKEKYQNNLMIR